MESVIEREVYDEGITNLEINIVSKLFILPVSMYYLYHPCPNVTIYLLAVTIYLITYMCFSPYGS